MVFHWPSFVIGYTAGFGTSALSKRFRPLFLEVATNVYRAADAVAARVLMAREDLQDLLAEARARAHALLARPVVH